MPANIPTRVPIEPKCYSSVGPIVNSPNGRGESYRTGARVTLSKSQHARELLEEIPTCASNRGCFPHAPANTPTRFPNPDKLLQQRWGHRKFTKRVGNIKNTNALQIFPSAPLPNMLQQMGARCATACLHPREDAYACSNVRVVAARAP